MIFINLVKDRLGLGGKIFKTHKFRTMIKPLAMIGQTEESNVNMGFRKAGSIILTGVATCILTKNVIKRYMVN